MMQALMDKGINKLHLRQTMSQRTGCLGCDAFKDVVDERVEDSHGLVGDTSVGVYLLED